ncbi:uncharacterized protein LOC129588757 [Paramacrobiotus metropolitanus]|uniref:uncharacterized protein LOC129588757 n=1 Tax=Paramacrobiotus metropolitanus TaxID=2943436 RepID=UPI002445921B|nr:uncharacterized protein LOC129588757 [Paramacrobiotus metropolitanus]
MEAIFGYSSLLNMLGCAIILLSVPDLIWKTPQPPGCPVNLVVSMSVSANITAFYGTFTGLLGRLCPEHATPTAQRITRWMFRLLAVWCAVLLQRTMAYLLRPMAVPHIASITAANVTNFGQTAVSADSAGTILPCSFILSMYITVPIILLWECTLVEFFPHRPGLDIGCEFCRNSPALIRFGHMVKIHSVVCELYALVHLLILT